MKRNHLFSIITAGMLTITLLAGCGNTGSNANGNTGSNTNTVQESTEDQASAVPESEAQITGEGQNGKTIIVTDVRGEVEIPADPQRIVDLSGNSDILSILGYSVVGTANSDAYDYTKFPTYLEDTLQGAEILGYSMQDTMDIEAVMNLDPDLIIISTVQEKMYDQLSEIAPTVMIQLEALNWKEDIRTLAQVFGARQCGVDKVFKVGGIQAIGAMTFGTESVPKVYKIFGPGNQYVTAAKQLACNYGTAIDMPAGPTEDIEENIVDMVARIFDTDYDDEGF